MANDDNMRLRRRAFAPVHGAAAPMTDIRKVEHLHSAVFYVAVALLAWLIFRVVSPFLQPLGWAGILAILIHPVRERLAKRWGAGRAALIGTLAVMVLLVGPGVLLAVYFV